MFTLAIVQSALELGFIYALVAMALFLSFRVLNIADMTTDGAFTLGCAVACQVALTGHPILALFAGIRSLVLCWPCWPVPAPGMSPRSCKPTWACRPFWRVLLPIPGFTP